MRSTPLLLALLALPLAAEDQVGPFRWGRWLYNPAAPQATAIGRNGDIESASQISGDGSAGRIQFQEWQGDNQAGSRSFSGNVLLAPAGSAYWFGAPAWDIQTGSQDINGVWSYPRRTQQDYKLYLGYAALTPAQLSAQHGAPTRIGSAIAANAVVLSLPMRWVSGSGSSFQNGAYNGNPPQTGVWAVPAGLSLPQAQQNAAANRLADLGSILSTFQPANGTWQVDFRVGAAGSWTLRLDVNGDGNPEYTVTSADAGRKSAAFTDVTGQSGLMLSLEAAGGNGTGYVGRTPVTFGYQAIATTPQPNQAPTLASGPTASAVSATKTITLDALGADDGGEAALTYAWSLVSGPAGGTATFSANNTNAAKHCVATVSAAGTWTFRVTATDTGSLSAGANAAANATAVAVSGTLTPTSLSVPLGGNACFIPAWKDQWAKAIAPASVTWSVSALGTIDGNGVFTPGATTGSAIVTAHVVDGPGATATINVVAAPGPIAIANPLTITLPGTITFKAVAPSSGPSYWQHTVLVGAGSLPAGPVPYKAWCAQKAVTLDNGAIATGTPWCSLDPAKPANLANAGWNRVNWVLNNKGAYNRDVIQDAIWILLGQQTSASSSGNQAAVTALVAAAQANGGSYVPPAGATLGIIIDLPDNQDTIIEIEVPPQPGGGNG